MRNLLICVVFLFFIGIGYLGLSYIKPSMGGIFGASTQCKMVNWLPDPACSPGLPDSAVTQKNIKKTICVSGYTKTVRNVSDSLKEQVYKEYGITSRKPGEYEIDHEIPLTVGGSNDIKNLWPQPYSGEWNARMKDVLENKLNDQVCKGKITLLEAQSMISKDWIKAYQTYVQGETD